MDLLITTQKTDFEKFARNLDELRNCFWLLHLVPYRFANRGNFAHPNSDVLNTANRK